MNHQAFLAFALRYCFRNLWRHRRRTILTIGTVLFSVAVATIANRYSRAIMKLWEDGAADTGTGHAQLHAQGYWQRQEGVQKSLTMAMDSALERQILADPDVAAAVRRIRVEGLVSTGDDSLYFVGIGVEPAGEMAVSPRLFGSRDQGRFVEEPEKHGLTVGKGLAESLKLKLGDGVTLITNTVDGSINGIDAKIVGIVDAGIPSFNKRAVYADVSLFQRLIRLPDRYTELAIRLKPGIGPAAWVKAREAQATAAGLELRGWWDVEPSIRRVGKIWDFIVLVITFLLFVSTTLSVSNIIYMMVAERTVEIGTLMAIGARPVDVKALFALEAALIGVIGGGLGALAGNGAVLLMDLIGVPFDSPFGADHLIVHPTVHLGVALTIFLCGILICQLSALAPSHKASQVEPVRAFRGQIT
jgi:putative ABC transport system permease protein